MQVTETLAEGLKRELKVVVPAQDMASQLNEKLAEAKGKMQIKGFRPGKVPISHLKKVYGRSMMAQLVNDMIQEKPTSILAERGERAATQPEIAMTEDEKEADQILSGAADFEFTMSYEVIPAFDVADMTSFKVVREIVDVPAEEVEEQVLR
ncbi:MAG: trigger factor family protein, partial [Hoeflea sp.]|nr:trigger factor family protein [Hoeflea sp.]